MSYPNAIRVLLISGTLPFLQPQASADDWKEELRHELKVLETEHLPKKMLSGRRILAYMHCMAFMNANVACQGVAEILSITKQSDGTTRVVFGKFGHDFKDPNARGRSSSEEKHPINDTALLVWRDPDRPVPLVTGMTVYLSLGADNVVHRFYYGPRGVVAVRQRPDSTWEELIRLQNSNDRQQRFLLIRANRTDLDPEAPAIEWNDRFGLCKGYWESCGAGPDNDAEALSSHSWRGLPAANVPGMRVKPGRDGWIPAKDIPLGVNEPVRQSLIPNEQFFQDGC